MEINIENSESQDLILGSLGLQKLDKPLTEADLLAYLSEAIAYMIEHELDMLLSLLYRLDIDEDKINATLHPKNPIEAHIGLAHLVINRQKQRISTKNEYRTTHNSSPDWSFEE